MEYTLLFQIKEIYLGNGSIGTEGLKHFSKTQWKLLKKAQLCNFLFN